MIEKTFIAIKPDGVERGLVGEVIKRFENAGLKIVGMKMLIMKKSFAKMHYKEHVKKDFYKGLEDFMTSGPVVAIAAEGVQAVEVVRKLVGSTEPKEALPGTIRGDFSHHSYQHADKKGVAVRNLVHASGNLKDAEYEVGLWFANEELCQYNSVHERHVF